MTLTVAEYALTRLKQLGIDNIFGVPGDYAFAIDDAVEKVEGLEWVACANELNAAYAADGYARLRGAAMLTTTYGVGELSAINGVMGSKAHRLPVFHLVGMPSQRIQRLGMLTHHNLGDTNYDRFMPISGAACCVTARLTPDNCVEEMERVVREALRQSMPAYIVISQVHGVMPILGTPVIGKPISAIKRQRSNSKELDAAVETICTRLMAAKSPMLVVAALVSRYGVHDTTQKLIQKLNISAFQLPSDKGSVDESLPQYAGLFAGHSSSSQKLVEALQNCDLLLDVGGVFLTELNTGLWSGMSAVPSSDKIISINDNWIRVGKKVFLECAIDDVLAALVTKAQAVVGGFIADLKPGLMPLVGEANDGTSSASFYPRLQRHIKPGDTLVVETGTCMLHLNRMWLPGVRVEGQGLWGSIGWATPAVLGVAMANEHGNTWMVTGDGSHQLTLNEIAVMGRYGIKPRIFVLNNGIYGVEDVISQRGHPYDDLAPVQYRLLPEAFGCKNWLSAKVSNVAELDEILDKIQSHDGAAYVEVMIPNEESQPLPEGAIDLGYKLATPPVG